MRVKQLDYVIQKTGLPSFILSYHMPHYICAWKLINVMANIVRIKCNYLPYLNSSRGISGYIPRNAGAFNSETFCEFSNYHSQSSN